MRIMEPHLVPERSIPLAAPPQKGDAMAARFEQQQSARLGVVMVEDEQAGWALPPTSTRQEGALTIRLNSLLLRGPEPQKGELRLLTLGDSSIYGVQVEEKNVFSSVAAESMTQGSGRAVTAFIGGVPGYSSGQAIEQLRRVNHLLRADWVVIGAIWSDVFRADMQSKTSTSTQNMRRFATWRVFRSLLAPYLPTQKVKWVDGKADVGSLDDGGIPPRTPLNDYITNLHTLAAETRKNGGQPVYLMLPAPMDQDVVPPPETVQVYRSAMREVAEAEHAPLLDGPALFKAQGADLSCFIDQVHPSREGHRRLGEALGALLLQEKLPDHPASDAIQ